MTEGVTERDFCYSCGNYGTSIKYRAAFVWSRREVNSNCTDTVKTGRVMSLCSPSTPLQYLELVTFVN